MRLRPAVVVLFQLGVASGKAWGEYTMGGRYPGRLPAVMRLAALVQGLVLAVLAAVVLDAAGLLALDWTDDIEWLPFVPVVVAAAQPRAQRVEPERARAPHLDAGRDRAAREQPRRRDPRPLSRRPCVDTPDARLLDFSAPQLALSSFEC